MSLRECYEAFEACFPLHQAVNNAADRRRKPPAELLDKYNETLKVFWDASLSLSKADRSVFAAYVQMREAGQSAKLAEMFAEQRPPQANTDATFLAGNANGKQFEDCQPLGDTLKAMAEREGQSVKGKKYLSQLARYPGDPEAWVDGRGDVARVVAKRGWRCSGSVNVAGSSEARRPGSGKGRKKFRLPKPDPESIRKINDGSIRAPS
jgi:hypothetical protein